MSDDMCVVAYELSNSDGETIIIRSERRQVESYKNRYSTDLVNELVRQSDALAKLAEKDAEIAEEQRISNMRADAVERWTNTCAQQDEVIDALRAEIARLRDVLSLFTAYESLMDDGECAAAVSAYANFQLKVHEALKGPEA